MWGSLLIINSSAESKSVFRRAHNVSFHPVTNKRANLPRVPYYCAPSCGPGMQLTNTPGTVGCLTAVFHMSRLTPYSLQLTCDSTTVLRPGCTAPESQVQKLLVNCTINNGTTHTFISHTTPPQVFVVINGMHC